jgi:hypothetical protein
MNWTVSVSQVDKFAGADGCQRKLGFDTWASESEYVQGLGAYRGDAAHAMIRAWGKEHIPPERSLKGVIAHLEREHAAELAQKNITADDYAGRIVAVVSKMLTTLPQAPWGGTVTTEGKYKIKIDGVPWWVRPDYESPLHLRDYKIVWSKQEIPSETDLLWAVQPNLYAWGRLERDKTNSVDCVWHYGVPGKHPSATVREFTLTRAHVEEQIAKIAPIGKRIYHLALAKTDPLTLEPNWNACAREFGSTVVTCPHLRKCKPDLTDMLTLDPTEETTETTGANTTMGSLLDELTGGAPAPKAEPKPAPKAETPKATAKEDELTGADPTVEILQKAKRMLAIELPAHEVVNGLKSMYPTVDVGELGKIVALAGGKNTPEAKAADVPKGNTPAPESKPEETPKKGPGRPKAEKTETTSAPPVLLTVLVDKLVGEIMNSTEDLKTRIALTAMLLHRK